MKKLFEKLLDDLKKYKLYIIIYLVVCIAIGILWGFLREREMDEYDISIEKRGNNLSDRYIDEYDGYRREIINDDDIIDSYKKISPEKPDTE